MSAAQSAPRAWVFEPALGQSALEREIGGKAAQLWRLEDILRHELPEAGVPRWIAIAADAFATLAGALADAASGADAEARAAAIRAVSVPDDLRRDVRAALERSGLAGHWLAVRSSAVGEDAASASFAGQFDTVLGVKADDDAALWDAIRRVWASAVNPHAAAYRARTGASPIRMGVILQELLDPEVSGVAFAADPVSGRRDLAVVSAVYGLGEGLVSGELDADAYRMSFRGLEALAVERTIATKDRAVQRANGGGTTLVSVPEALRAVPALSDDEARVVARAARTISRAQHRAQDLEWALVAGPAGSARALKILQTRAITTLPPHAASLDAERRVWDNSNIVESYCGVTTPLTFSFARSVYEDVYRQFCRLMGVSGKLIDEHQAVFANLLGLVRGRVYYNLLNWYRTLALLPGFAFNRGFMERMMGVREALTDAPAPPSSGDRFIDLVRLVRAVAGMLFQNLALAHEVPAFHARVQAALGPLLREDLTRWSPDELAALYRRLERDLLRHWRAPLVNDFFAMVFFGTLGKLTERWLPGSPPTLVNDLLCGEGGIISTEPARAVMTLAREVAGDPALRAAFATLAPPANAVQAAPALWEHLHREPAFRGFAIRLDAYVERFGDRCMEELKLETVTLGEDPGFLLQMIRAYAERGTIDPDAALARERTIRGQAEAIVRGQLQGQRRWTYEFVLGQTRTRVRDRENLRFERTRVFGIVRRIFLGFGHHLAAAQRLAGPRDIFYLTREEIFGWLEGTTVTHDFRALVALRRAEFAEYERTEPPPDRFETWGPAEESFKDPNSGKADRRPSEVPGRSGVGRAGVEGPRAGRPEASGARDGGSEPRKSEAEQDAEPSVPALGPSTPAPRSRALDSQQQRTLTGTGCCPGIVRERVVIVRDPRIAPDVSGKILVAERTDPGWTLLFPAARGLLVQRGSLLSHSAIVAREMGLPCVVGIAGLLDTLRDGEEVEMDGAAGTVRRLDVIAP